MYKINYIRELLEQFSADDQNRTAIKLYNGQRIKDITYTELAENILSAAGCFQENGGIRF